MKRVYTQFLLSAADFPAKEKITAKSVLTNGTDTIIDDSAFKLIMEL